MRGARARVAIAMDGVIDGGKSQESGLRKERRVKGGERAHTQIRKEVEEEEEEEEEEEGSVCAALTVPQLSCGRMFASALRMQPCRLHSPLFAALRLKDTVRMAMRPWLGKGETLSPNPVTRLRLAATFYVDLASVFDFMLAFRIITHYSRGS